MMKKKKIWRESLVGEMKVGNGEIDHSMIQYQATHDQVAATRPLRQKRGGPRLDDDEKKRNKREVDKRYRVNAKNRLKEMKDDLKAAKNKVEDLESANKSLMTQYLLMVQKLQEAQTWIGQLQSEIKGFKETSGAQQQQHAVIYWNQAAVTNIKELQSQNYILNPTTTERQQFADLYSNGLNHIQELPMEQVQFGQEENECMNASLMAERDTAINDLQATVTNIEEFQSQKHILNPTITGQQQFADLYSNGLNHGQEFPMEQVQLGQDENGRLGRPIATSVPEIQSTQSEMSQLVLERWKRELEEAMRNDRAERKGQMDDFIEEMRACRARLMSKCMKSRNVYFISR
ncbi:uncharacterized protein LOC119980277 isoform X2 [Tripterygium wilfordii]|uniref:uncharacterized protein LOC119980277 isoform X2 n=2 Tax=Tripterygium wilfordii TaxID=458696 RepID=UPI0018F80B57|nr:uncharacterized protein LOC119980277 isoform X2 [Tripterygium wilfordii]